MRIYLDDMIDDIEIFSKRTELYKDRIIIDKKIIINSKNFWLYFTNNSSWNGKEYVEMKENYIKFILSKQKSFYPKDYIIFEIERKKL